ncbi:type IV pilus biogenesis/stability protein PilW [Acidovorax lacteus]|uniref:Type IV pilus biogenesis/stability protein PilW n=2 Tax=Acidovorax lacteus TaxID=1924988 RepID=A0ABP8KWN2_9BURK
MILFPSVRMWSTGLAALVGLAAIALLSGCASSPSVATDGASTIVTASDEPEQRRRARIRLELASNYFENGQTTVALDEVKQSLAADPAYPDAHNMRGLIYMRLGDLGLADESFRRALALRPNDANILHNQAWLLCQQGRYAEADQVFVRALANPAYTARGKTLMAQGLCLVGAQQFAQAEQVLLRAYELDAANPVVAYHLGALLLRRNELTRAQFYVRRLNNGEFANAESLWLGIKIERQLGDTVAMRQLAEQLRRRFPDSRELASFERGAFHE